MERYGRARSLSPLGWLRRRLRGARGVVCATAHVGGLGISGDHFEGLWVWLCVCAGMETALYVSGWFHEASDWQQGWLTHTNRSAEGRVNGGVRRLKACAREQQTTVGGVMCWQRCWARKREEAARRDGVSCTEERDCQKTTAGQRWQRGLLSESGHVVPGEGVCEGGIVKARSSGWRRAVPHIRRLRGPVYTDSRQGQRRDKWKLSDSAFGYPSAPP